MENYKIKVNNESESKEAQKLFFELGYKWSGAVATYLSIGGFKFITAYPDEMRLAMGWGDDADKELTLPQLRDLVAKSKPTEQVLISGADALRALAENKNVQCSIAGKNDWTVDILTITPYHFIGMGSGQFQFRLKPRTIKLELEIPAPFEPKEKDIFWTLSTNYECGYVQILCYRNDEQGERLSQFGAWRTEDEIKQVVAALRGIKG